MEEDESKAAAADDRPDVIIPPNKHKTRNAAVGISNGSSSWLLAIISCVVAAAMLAR